MPVGIWAEWVISSRRSARGIHGIGGGPPTHVSPAGPDRRPARRDRPVRTDPPSAAGLGLAGGAGSGGTSGRPSVGSHAARRQRAEVPAGVAGSHDESDSGRDRGCRCGRGRGRRRKVVGEDQDEHLRDPS